MASCIFNLRLMWILAASLSVYFGAALVIVPLTWRAARQAGRSMDSMKFFAARPAMLVIMLLLWPLFLLWAWHDAKIPVSKGEYVIPSPEGIGDFVGSHGSVVTGLRPVGKVKIGEDEVQAISVEGPIASGSQVEVVGTDGGFVRVRRGVSSNKD